MIISGGKNLTLVRDALMDEQQRLEGLLEHLRKTALPDFILRIHSDTVVRCSSLLKEVNAKLVSIYVDKLFGGEFEHNNVEINDKGTTLMLATALSNKLYKEVELAARHRRAKSDGAIIRLHRNNVSLCTSLNEEAQRYATELLKAM